MSFLEYTPPVWKHQAPPPDADEEDAALFGAPLKTLGILGLLAVPDAAAAMAQGQQMPGQQGVVAMKTNQPSSVNAYHDFHNTTPLAQPDSVNQEPQRDYPVAPAPQPAPPTPAYTAPSTAAAAVVATYTAAGAAAAAAVASRSADAPSGSLATENTAEDAKTEAEKAAAAKAAEAAAAAAAKEEAAAAKAAEAAAAAAAKKEAAAAKSAEAAAAAKAAAVEAIELKLNTASAYAVSAASIVSESANMAEEAAKAALKAENADEARGHAQNARDAAKLASSKSKEAQDSHAKASAELTAYDKYAQGGREKFKSALISATEAIGIATKASKAAEASAARAEDAAREAAAREAQSKAESELHGQIRADAASAEVYASEAEAAAAAANRSAEAAAASFSEADAMKHLQGAKNARYDANSKYDDAMQAYERAKGSGSTSGILGPIWKTEQSKSIVGDAKQSMDRAGAALTAARTAAQKAEASVAAAAAKEAAAKQSEADKAERARRQEVQDNAYKKLSETKRAETSNFKKKVEKFFKKRFDGAMSADSTRDLVSACEGYTGDPFAKAVCLAFRDLEGKIPKDQLCQECRYESRLKFLRYLYGVEPNAEDTANDTARDEITKNPPFMVELRSFLNKRADEITKEAVIMATAHQYATLAMLLFAPASGVFLWGKYDDWVIRNMAFIAKGTDDMPKTPGDVESMFRKSMKEGIYTEGPAIMHDYVSYKGGVYAVLEVIPVEGGTALVSLLKPKRRRNGNDWAVPPGGLEVPIDEVRVMMRSDETMMRYISEIREAEPVDDNEDDETTETINRNADPNPRMPTGPSERAPEMPTAPMERAPSTGEVVARKTFSGSGVLEITESDVIRLSDDDEMNDAIVDFYMGLMQERQTEDPPKSHFFDTYFYNKLKSGGYDNVESLTRIERLGYCILDCDYIFVPINIENWHWTLAVIYPYDKCVVYYDSMGGENYKALELLRDYFAKEYQTRKRNTLDVKHWALYSAPDAPKQRNNFDCGVFMIKYAQCISNGETMDFTQDDMHGFRSEIGLSILNAGIEELKTKSKAEKETKALLRFNKAYQKRIDKEKASEAAASARESAIEKAFEALPQSEKDAITRFRNRPNPGALEDYVYWSEPLYFKVLTVNPKYSEKYYTKFGIVSK